MIHLLLKIVLFGALNNKSIIKKIEGDTDKYNNVSQDSDETT